MKSSSLSTGFLAGFAIVLCATSAQASNQGVESALKSRSELSMFTEAMTNTGVADELKDSKSYTVFAPTNTAFARVMPKDMSACYESAACKSEVAAIVRNHIVPAMKTVDAMAPKGNHTIGTRVLSVQKPAATGGSSSYMVSGNAVGKETTGEQVIVYSIQGVIASQQDMSSLRTQSGPAVAETAPEKQSVPSPALAPMNNPMQPPIVPPRAPTHW